MDRVHHHPTDFLQHPVRQPSVTQLLLPLQHIGQKRFALRRHKSEADLRVSLHFQLLARPQVGKPQWQHHVTRIRQDHRLRSRRCKETHQLAPQRLQRVPPRLQHRLDLPAFHQQGYRADFNHQPLFQQPLHFRNLNPPHKRARLPLPHTVRNRVARIRM